MSKRPFDLLQLLGPIMREAFFNVHWERKPLHLSRTDANYYDAVLTIADLERIISSPEARHPSVQLSKSGAYFPPEVYCEDVRFGADSFTGVPNPEKVAFEYQAGATIVMPALHRT